MEPEEKTVVGVLFLLFGVSWLAYANTQPLVHIQGTVCSLGGGTPNLPSCTHLDYTASLFYFLGVLATLIGAVFLAWRAYTKYEPTRPAS